MIRKVICLALALCLCLSLGLRAGATGAAEPYAQQLIQYYRHYQGEAEDVIWDILNQMAAVDPNQAAVWGNIMEDWAWVNDGMPVSQGVLPDGLPEDDSLCIVVLGYDLEDSGAMREELIDRLVVALASALKYPNAWIAVTGGQTSSVKGITEAGQMAAWLRRKGVDPDRILVDHRALNTTANARNVYGMLDADYPQVDSIAVVTSDYHVTWGSALLAAISNYTFGYSAGNPIDLVGAAVCETGKTLDAIAYQVLGICEITGVPYQESAAPPLYYVDRPTEPETIPTEKTQGVLDAEPENHPAPAAGYPQEGFGEEKERSFWPFVLLAGMGCLVAVLTPKKPKKKRQRPEWKWD